MVDDLAAKFHNNKHGKSVVFLVFPLYSELCVLHRIETFLIDVHPSECAQAVFSIRNGDHH